VWQVAGCKWELKMTCVCCLQRHQDEGHQGNPGLIHLPVGSLFRHGASSGLHVNVRGVRSQRRKVRQKETF